MPELPEVETLRRGLAARITGMHITAVEIGDLKIFGGSDDAIKHDVSGHQISRVARRGKVLILYLREPGGGAAESGSLLIHPKMTGQLVLTCDGAIVFAGGHPTPAMLRPMPNATTRAVFRLGPACSLYYNDARRFGWIRTAGPDPCQTDPFLARLGPDPLDAGFTPAVLQQALARHPRAPVKAVLLDQTAIAGIGNIYADEVLHRACIHPSRPAGGLSRAEALRLHAAIYDILRAATDSGGTSFAGYVNQARGRPGYLGQAHVFRRQSLPCQVCGTPIVRTAVAGRATNFCPHCQQR
ncbi:MAG TPA: bifunctional DNA-formamidopyrimidine glycosylase/DNA-(apurinic or apyrimidinic site) lyase [Streptosporangiaceae bacterium]|nr:bifunctional DNA-formamidopyrimidine glycosylase/DNA-(apurinic or apyrimidinic site) lyase [Streptosporangiaceae bacterium]